MNESCVEGPAADHGLESCVHLRKSVGEALTGVYVRAGYPEPILILGSAQAV